MARHVVTSIRYEDDLTGEPYADGEGETVAYSLDGAGYEIDLADQNAKALREMLAPYIAASRKTGGATANRPKQTRRNRAEIRAIKEWGRANNFDVPDAGRVPEVLVRAYDEAHPPRR